MVEILPVVVEPPLVVSTQLCSKCGNTGIFRKGHRQCRECELEYRKISRDPQKDTAYRLANRDKYRKKNSEIQRRRKIERHTQIDLIKSVPCKDCGGIFPPYVMDFDHRNLSTKEHDINFLLNNTTCPWQRILDEIAKCDVVCVCCHRMRTWKTPVRLDNRRKLVIEKKSVPCADCGENFHYCQMDFDHVRGEKLDCVSRLKSRNTLLTEIEKCDVVCANCHRKRTQARGVQRLEPQDVNMVWEHHKDGTPQTVVSTRPKLVVPSPKEWHSLAGTMTDAAVASIADVTASNVCIYRRKMGIPSFMASRSKKMKTELAQ